MQRLAQLEKENKTLRSMIEKLEARVAALEVGGGSSQQAQPPKAAPAPAAEEEDDDDVDLFGSDEEEDEEAKRIKEERLAMYAAKKSKKPELIAKSSILLDVSICVFCFFFGLRAFFIYHHGATFNSTLDLIKSKVSIFKVSMLYMFTHCCAG